MALTETEELELLGLERERSFAGSLVQPTPQRGFTDIVQTIRDLPGVRHPVLAGGRLGEKITDLYGRGGEALAETLPREGVRPLNIPGVPLPLLRPGRPGEPVLRTGPKTAAAIGTGVSMIPDIAMTATTPLGASRGAVRAAVPLARRALGSGKAMLKTPFARGQATKAAQIALEEGVIPWSGSPTTALERAGGLVTKFGAKIGEKLKAIPANFKAVFDDLEKLRGSLTQGTKGGVYSKTNTAIDTVQETVMELQKGGIRSLKTVSNLKKKIGDSINYLADLASQSENKAIVDSLANTMRETVKKVVPPGEFIDFLNSQRMYNAAKLMVRGLDNEVAGQMGGRMISPQSLIVGAGQVAAGGPGAVPRAAASLGLWEAGMRRAAGPSARLIQEVGTQVPRYAPKVGAVAGPSITRALTEDEAREYLRKAGGDANLARQMATRENRSF